MKRNNTCTLWAISLKIEETLHLYILFNVIGLNCFKLNTNPKISYLKPYQKISKQKKTLF